MGPIFIMGVSRSGTRMLARCLGRADGVCLITEHKDKSDIPEEDNPVSDHEFWRETFPGQQTEEVPDDPVAFAQLRSRWERQAAGRRLVIKNPQNVVRTRQLRQAFPDAEFVWLIRDPWAVIQSMVADKRTRTRIQRSQAILSLPDDRLLRAAASWAAGIEAMGAPPEIITRYERLVGGPHEEVSRLFELLSLSGANRAAEVPRNKKPDYTLARYMLRRSPYRRQVMDMIAPLARDLGYHEYPPGIPGDTYWFGAKCLATWLRQPKTLPPYGFPRLEKLRAARRSWIGTSFGSSPGQ